MTSRPVVVVGLMGAGKTSVATRLAEALGRDRYDSDEDLAAVYGQNAAEHVERYGPTVLHSREADRLRVALAHRPPAVIAAAASVVEDPDIRRDLADAFVVWLDAPPAVLAERMRGGDHRPRFDADVEKMLVRQRDRRAGWFAEVADLVVDVQRMGPDQAAAAVLAAVGRDGG